MTLTLSDIQAAHERIKPYIIETPVLRLHNLEEILGCEVYVKLENMQRTKAFKLRGVMNALLQLTDEELKRGVVTSSSGNHGHAVAYASKMLGIKATVAVPDTAPPFKLQKIAEHGAEIIPTTVEERFKLQESLVEEHGYTLIPPFNDYRIMAGQGTVGLEILEQLPNVDHIFVPTSGGGLIGGISTAVKGLKDNVKIHGVEPANLPKFSTSLKNGELTQVENKGTIADGLVSIIPGEKNFPVVQKYVDTFHTVSEEAMKKGQKLMLMEAKILTEISSSIAIGGILNGEIEISPEDKICFIITGGNLGFDQLDYIKDTEY
ncbi:MAG: threonine/serine dehydratase [Jeotgalicoccus sp.]|nr:threonine/serine dehydratase [Jeotgalicoccus sp.]